MAGAERETAIIIARNVRHAVAGETRCGVALYRAEDKLFCYWCLVNYSRSNGLNQRSLTNGRQRPISIQPRATPWVYGRLGLRPERAKALKLRFV